MNPEELIAAGPSDSQESTKDRLEQKVAGLFEGEVGYEKPIKLDAFEKAKNGLDEEVEEKLKKEEAKADKEEEIENEEEKTLTDPTPAKKLESAKETNETEKTEDKKETEQTDKPDGLVHLELGISPKSVSHFKNMNRAAREWVTSELKTRLGKITELSAKVKELEESKTTSSADGNGLPASWYEHPQAVQLLPDYQKAVEQVGQVRSLIEHYRQQKVAIAEGETWYDIVQDGNGNWTKKAYKPNAQATAHVDDKIAEVRAYEQRLLGQVQNIQTNFNTNAIKTREQVIKLEDQYFPQYKDTKSLEKNDNWKAINQALSNFGVNNDRLSGVVAKMYLYTMETQEENERLTKELEKLKTTFPQTKVVEKKKGNGPTGDEINRGTATKKYTDPDDEPVDLSIFEKRKEQFL